MTVLVSVTHYDRTRPYVERAVRSVLAQTHRDLVCVVIGDGDEPPLSIRDDRLIVHSYPVNRGAYFAQDVAIWASPFGWYAPVAADDWIDPDHIERLFEEGGDLCAGGVRLHNDHYCPGDPDHVHCTGTIVPGRRRGTRGQWHPGWERGERKAYEVGLYHVDRYREIGAHNPNERIGQDSATLHVQRMVAPIGVSNYLTYNRLGRAGSLCTDPATDAHSPARRAMKVRNAAMYAVCEQIKNRNPDRRRRASLIRAYRESLVPRDVKNALAVEVEALRAKVGRQAVAA